jgi:uncharacterized protein YycO
VGLFDKAKKLLDQHDSQVDDAIEKLGDVVDQKTGGKYADKVDQAQHLLEEKTGDGDTNR